MPKSGKKNKKKSFFRLVHLRAIIFIILYSLVSKTLFIKALATKDPVISFLVPYIFGVAAGIILLYLLNHEDFFHFIKEVEKVEDKKEKQFLKKYKHYGKLLGTMIIATIGGPIFSAFTIRLLLNRVWYKYALIAVGNLFSTILAVTIGFNIFKLF